MGASSLTGPHSSATGDSLATTAEVEPDRTSTSCRSSTYQETHFDSSALREAHYESSPHCPLHPHHTLHIVREGVRREGEGRLLASSSTVHLHTMPPNHQGAATLPHHHPSLFEASTAASSTTPSCKEANDNDGGFWRPIQIQALP